MGEGEREGRAGTQLAFAPPLTGGPPATCWPPALCPIPEAPQKPLAACARAFEPFPRNSVEQEH